MQHIHVGDVGTLYRIPIAAEDINGDPATASTREIIFSFPDPVVVTRNLDSLGSPAQGGQVLSDGRLPTVWFFNYTVQDADVVLGSPAGDFHNVEGEVTVQVHLKWDDGNEWHSDVFTESIGNLRLKVYANLV